MDIENDRACRPRRFKYAQTNPSPARAGLDFMNLDPRTTQAAIGSNLRAAQQRLVDERLEAVSNAEPGSESEPAVERASRLNVRTSDFVTHGGRTLQHAAGAGIRKLGETGRRAVAKAVTQALAFDPNRRSRR